MVKSDCGIGEVYMCFNGTGIWGGETLTELSLRLDLVTNDTTAASKSVY